MLKIEKKLDCLVKCNINRDLLGGGASGAMAPPLFKDLLSDFAQKESLEQCSIK